MLHLQFFSVGMALVDKASDGNLTLEEVAEVLNDAYPDKFDDLLEEVRKANVDGHYTIGEILKILSAAIF